MLWPFKRPSSAAVLPHGAICFLTFTTTSLKLFFNFDIWQSWEWLPSFIWFYTHRVPVKNQYTVSNHRQSLALSDQSNENIKDVFFFIYFFFYRVCFHFHTYRRSDTHGIGFWRSRRHIKRICQRCKIRNGRWTTGQTIGVHQGIVMCDIGV